MDVRICGPNLNDQSKGTFHVHDTNCNDLVRYGPGKQYGGDMNGIDEQLVTDATIDDVIIAVYDNGIIDEMVGDRGMDRASAIDSLISDFWFAPCCINDLIRAEDAQHAANEAEKETDEVVFECWVSGTPEDSFVKLSYDDVRGWCSDWIGQLEQGQHLHVVAHNSKEYTE